MEGNSPDLTEIQGTGQSAVVSTVDNQPGGHDNGASEEQGSPAPEKSPVQEKIDLVMNMVRSKNALLGGRVAGEVSLDDGSSIVVFAQTTTDRVGRVSRAYGVDSTQGPISISAGAGLESGIMADKGVDLEKALESLKDNGRLWVHLIEDKPQNMEITGVETLLDWRDAFVNSVQNVLKDPDVMRQIEEKKIAVLDKALTFASQPIQLETQTEEDSRVRERVDNTPKPYFKSNAPGNRL